MSRQVFQHRSNRVIAASRLVIAILFGLWVWLDPDQPVRGRVMGTLLLEGYAVFALVLLAISWKNWWLDFRLSVPSFLVDCAMFLSALYFTQSSSTDLVSPFMTFFAYLLLSAVLRWQWKHALAATTVLGIGFLLVGFLLAWADIDIDVVKFIRRTTFLSVLSVLLVWFARERSFAHVPRLNLATAAESASPPLQALAYAMRMTDADEAALTWASTDEPRLQLYTAGALGDGVRCLPPGTCEPPDRDVPMLFDAARRRALARDTDERFMARREVDAPDLAAFLGVSEGLYVPLDGNCGRGQLVVGGISGMCGDHAVLGQRMSHEISRALDEEELQASAREMAIARIRSSIARDLHDSVAQSLAGTSFRLASLRNLIRSGRDPLPELDAICESLGTEQQNVRVVIERLRSREPGSGSRNLSMEISALLDKLTAHWGIQAGMAERDEPVYVSAWLLYEIQQLVREAIANAVRHGSARKVELGISTTANELTLTINDDGSGFSEPASPVLPRSISERVSALGGTLAVKSQTGNTRIEITLPMRGHA